MPPGKGCIYMAFLPCPGAFVPIAQHGGTDGWQPLPGTGGYGCGWINGKGSTFLLRPLLRRKGLWAGLVAWGLVLVWLQGLVWAVDYGSLTTGQRARAGAVLRSCGLQPGTAVTEELLRTGEYSLLESGEFSWASLNFEKGRLVVEAAPARARPEIAAGTLHGLRAKCNGTVLRTNLASGTMLVVPGQAVEAGQGLIGTARSERDGTLIFAPAAGTVVAQLEWQTDQSVPLAETMSQLTGENKTNYRLFFAGHSAALSPFAPDRDGLCRTRHLQLEVFGLPLPCAVEETTYYGQQQKIDVPHRGAGTYTGTVTGAASTARCFPGCRHPRPPGGMHGAGGYPAL